MSRAPKFWPMMGPTAPESEKVMPKATTATRFTTVRAAATSGPKRAATASM